MRIPPIDPVSSPPCDDGWHLHTITHASRVYGTVDQLIGCNGIFVRGGRILDTLGFTASATASTVGDGGDPRGSTELDRELGRNCQLDKREYAHHASIIYGLRRPSYGLQRGDCNCLNWLLHDLIALVQLNTTRISEIPGDKRDIGVILTRFTLLHSGRAGINALAKALDRNPRHRQKLGGPLGHVDINLRRATLTARIAGNYAHIWTTGADEDRVITEEAIERLPPVMRTILRLRQSGEGTCLVRDGIHSGERECKLLMDNLGSDSPKNGQSTFTEIAASWISDFLLNARTADDDTGDVNGIFDAFGIDFNPPTTNIGIAHTLST